MSKLLIRHSRNCQAGIHPALDARHKIVGMTEGGQAIGLGSAALRKKITSKGCGLGDVLHVRRIQLVYQRHLTSACAEPRHRVGGGAHTSRRSV